MFRPVSPQIDWIRKVVTFSSEFLQDLLKCSQAHFSPTLFFKGPLSFSTPASSSTWATISSFVESGCWSICIG
ncbi:unnamed protein product, partial [Vitis vinifera]